MEEMPKFHFEYIYEKEFFKHNFHLYIAKAKNKEMKEWLLWAVPTKSWKDPEHHLKEPCYLGRWKNGKLETAKDFYTLDWSIQNTCRNRFFEEVTHFMVKNEVK